MTHHHGYARVRSLIAISTNFPILERPDFISGYIAAVEKDSNGYLWLTTTNGLYRINIQKNIFVGFSRTDGINNDNFILAASGKLPDGRLIFGSTDQLIIFNPAEIHLAAPAADIKITDFQLMNQSLAIDSAYATGGNRTRL